MAATTQQPVAFNPTQVGTRLATNPPNYPYWKLQVESLLDGFGLLSYISTDTSAPQSTLPAAEKAAEGTTAAKPNPEYEFWRRQDRLIFNLIVGTINERIAATIPPDATSRQAWVILYDQFARPSTGRVRQIKAHLKSIERGTQSVIDFAYYIKSKADELALLGEPMSQIDLVETILEKLGDGFAQLAYALQARETPVKFEELVEKLMTHQVKVSGSSPAQTLFQPVIANAAYRPPAPRPTAAHPAQNQWRPGSSQQPSATQSQPSANRSQQVPPNQVVPPRPNALGQPRKPWHGTCQLCRSFGHSARYCPIYIVPNLPPITRNNPAGSPARQPTPAAYTAMADSPPQHPSAPWLLDSGTTHHVTSDYQNLSMHQPYYGSDNLFVGDGSPDVSANPPWSG